MITRKMDRVNKEMKRALAKIIQFDLNDPRLNGVMISVVRCEVTSDEKYCKAYVSVFPIDNAKEIIDVLSSCQGYIRRCLKSEIVIRNIPQITFVLDRNAEYADHIESVLKGIKEGDE